MAERKFEILEEDRIIVYDETDDYDPGEEETSEFHLITNEEIFTEEYMQDYSAKMDAKIAREKRTQGLISAGVIIAIVIYVSVMVAVIF